MREATAELAGIAAVYTTPGMQAELAATRGAVALLDGDPALALPLCEARCPVLARDRCSSCGATVSVLIGLACRAMGDEEPSIDLRPPGCPPELHRRKGDCARYESSMPESSDDGWRSQTPEALVPPSSRT